MARYVKDRHITWLGVVLFVAYIAQAQLGLKLDALARLQAEDRYKMLSGVALGLWVLFQARLARQREREPRRAVDRHKLVGALSPVVLYLHASRFAYGYLLVLVWLYFGTFLVGLVHRPVVAARAPALFTWWFIIHVSLSTFLLVFGAYHLIVAVAYE